MLPYKNWFDAITLLAREHGIKFFFPEQIEILRAFYNSLYKSEKKVICISAPPACGKTFVTSIISKFYNNKEVAIVVPFNELKNDFVDILKDEPNIDVLTLYEYVKLDKVYDFVFIDESHNIASIIEFESEYIKILKFNTESPNFDIFLRFIPPNRNYIARRLHAESVKWILDNVIVDQKIFLNINLLRNTLSKWKCFLYMSNNYVELKFILGDKLFDVNLGKIKTYLISATPLTKDELKLYCNIDKTDVEDFIVIDRIRKFEVNVKYFEFECVLSETDKINVIIDITNNYNHKTLILFNNIYTSKKIYDILRNKITNRLVHIPSGLTIKDRNKIYEDFLNTPNSILLTPSSVYWEGLNIKNLSILILYQEPYPKPNVIDLYKNKYVDYNLTMKRRIIQGMGRIGRKDRDVGLGFALFRVSEYIDNNIIKININDFINTINSRYKTIIDGL